MYPPPPRPQSGGLSRSAIIVISIVVIVIVVGVVLAGDLLAGREQALAPTKPNVAIIDPQGSYTDDCGAGGSKQTKWHFKATLVNTGGTGFAEIGYDVNGQQVQQNTYYIYYKSTAFVAESATVNVCYGTTTPTYAIVLLAER